MNLVKAPYQLENRNIVVQTRKGNSIRNEQCFEISRYEQSLFPEYERKYRVVDRRGDPTAIYNCHGMTFASRRTCIHEAQEILRILEEDNYEPVAGGAVLPGDIVLYFVDEGDIEHSGIVLQTGPLGMPLIYSKWGKYREIIHYANMCPYDPSNLRYFRIRR